MTTLKLHVRQRTIDKYWVEPAPKSNAGLGKILASYGFVEHLSAKFGIVSGYSAGQLSRNGPQIFTPEVQVSSSSSVYDCGRHTLTRPSDADRRHDSVGWKDRDGITFFPAFSIVVVMEP